MFNKLCDKNIGKFNYLQNYQPLNKICRKIKSMFEKNNQMFLLETKITNSTIY